MKQLLTVTAILLCAYLTQGFTTPGRSKNVALVKHADRTGVNKWKNTTG